MLLAALGGFAGILSAVWGIDLLKTWLGESLLAAGAIHLDGTVLSFTAGLSLLVGLGCGLIPARQSLGQAATDLQTALHGQTAVAGANRLRSLLVIAEMALAVVLLCGAGLLLRSFAQLQQTDSGLLRPEQVLTAQVSLPAERYPDVARVHDFYTRTVARLQGLPGVKGAGVISLLPLQDWGMNGDVELDGHPLPPAQAPLAEFRSVAGDYFRTMGVSLQTGRLIDARDSASAPPAIVINRALVRSFGQTENEILGGKITFGSRHFTIVGVVADVRQSGLDRPARPEIYFPIAQAPTGEGPGQNFAQTATLVLRAQAVDPASLAQAMRRVVQGVDPGLPLYHIETLRSVISASVADSRTNTLLLGCFAAVALALAALGLYGVVSYAVTQRTRELGIRMALGAQRGDLFRLIVGSGMKLALIGLGAGLLAAFGLTRFLASLLHEVKPIDPVTFAGVIVVLGLVALLANYLPARRATSVNPTEALRAE